MSFITQLFKREKLQTNYDAIRSMTPKQLAEFLDEVWCIGCNDGLALGSLPQGEADNFEESIIFDKEWMMSPADPAILSQCRLFGKHYMMEASVNALCRTTGVDLRSDGEEHETPEGEIHAFAPHSK